jgi:hypothetical protein
MLDLAGPTAANQSNALAVHTTVQYNGEISVYWSLYRSNLRASQAPIYMFYGWYVSLFHSAYQISMPKALRHELQHPSPPGSITWPCLVISTMVLCVHALQTEPQAIAVMCFVIENGELHFYVIFLAEWPRQIICLLVIQDINSISIANSR